VVDYRYLAKSTTRSKFRLITYIAFVTKMQKRQTPEKRFTLIGKRYHNQLKRCQNERYIADIQSMDNVPFTRRAANNGSRLKTRKADLKLTFKNVAL
jgi:hypothetical protein